jgi:hypothetical protein
VSSDADAPAGEAKTPQGGGSWSITRILAVATSVVAVAAGAVSLLFKVDPAAEPCLGGANASFVDAPVFPESRQEYGYVSNQEGLYVAHPGALGAEVRATVEVENLRGNPVALYYTLLTAGTGGTADRVVSGADELPTRTQTVSSCSWHGGFDIFVEPQATAANPRPTGLDPRKTYRIVLELFEGERAADGSNRLALFETPVFRG